MSVCVKIIGAGSIGNHLAQAARRMGWDVTVVDRDQRALDRMRYEIYPGRYGAWDTKITLRTSTEEPRGGFDIIMIGTPPDSHLALALQALKEKPKILQIEKPLCPPFDPKLPVFLASAKKSKTIVVVGYDHAISKAAERIRVLLKKRTIGKPITLDVEFREHWQGIFKAHPWLSGPQDTYLGFWKRGGGASGEHSHALHLWQDLARAMGLGVWKSVSPTLKVEKKGGTEYDSLASFVIETDSGMVGRAIQDVITLPTRKWIRLQGDKGFIEWIVGGSPDGDYIRYTDTGGIREEIIKKKRPDDFHREMLHLKALLNRKIRADESPLSLKSAVSVIRLLEKSWKNRGRSSVLL